MSPAGPALSPHRFVRFGALLRYLRRRARLSRRELALAIGYSESHVSRLERTFRPPDQATLRALFVPALGLNSEPEWAERLVFLAEAERAAEPPTQRDAPPAPHPAPLLTTKLFRPSLRAELVVRPHLLSALDHALTVPLTLIAAPAGFGKTTLLADWITAHADGGDIANSPALDTCWLSLDSADNDPVTFLRYLVGALQTAAPEVGATTLTLIQTPLPPPAALLTPLINDLAALPIACCLALDDYHLITTPQIHQMLAFLIDHLPPQVHVIIASREDPPLALARLRARRQVVELRAADLRFTRAEAEHFLRDVMHLAVTTEQVAAVETHTEGWIAGLQLAGLALKERPDAAQLIAGLAGGNRYVVDYLASEVLDQLPAHLRAFLLQTAILGRMCGGLCDAVLGLEATAGAADTYSRLILHELERLHLFVVPLDSERRWYRYHHLFGAFLNSRLLGGATSEQVAELHRRAGAWFAEHGYLAEAVNHALAAGDVERAATLIETVAQDLMLNGQSSTLTAWLRAVPDTLLATRPRLCSAQIWAAFGRAEFGAAEPYVQLMETAIATLDPAAAAFHRTEIAAARSIILSYRDDPAAPALGREALAGLPQHYPAYGVVTVFYGIANYRNGDLATASSALEDALSRNEPALHLLVNRIGLLVVLASVRRMQGRLEEALQLARDVERLAWQGGQLFPSTATARALLEAGAVLRERNHLDAAERILRQCLDLCTQFAGHGYHVIACLYLAQVLRARGDAAAAWTWLDRAHTGLRAQPAWPASAQEIAGYRILLALACDDQATADAWAATQDPPAQRPLTPFALDRFALARTYIAQQRWEAAHATLDALAQAAEAGGFGYFLIWAHCLQALTFQAQKQPERALDALSRALILAAPEGYVRVFVDEGAPMAALLRAIRTRNVTPAYVYRLLDAFSPTSADEPHQPPDQSALVEPLTARELEVLRLIAAGASNQGVADALILSVGTVKKHINNILGKLGVHSRTHALARARELGLL